MAIPFFSIDFGCREWAALLKTIITGQIRTGNNEELLVDILKNRYGKDKYILMLPSARFGFALMVQQMFREGDEVIVPAMGFPLYVKILLQHNIKPIFVDVEPVHYTIDCEQIRSAITANTRGILVTHMFGHPCDMDKIVEIAAEFGILLIEDCAQSCGSYYKGKETGTFGDVALVSSSVMKVPTTLGGGILITSNQELYVNICDQLANPEYNFDCGRFLRYYIFALISILNSYPAIYSILSHHVFGLIKNRNPHLLRKILYSGLGLHSPFSIWERPRFANYQAAIGCIQFQRAEHMTAVRRNHARILSQQLQCLDTLHLPVENNDCHWNWQYYVIRLKHGSTQDVIDEMFSKGIHLMPEDVWDCTRYEFSKEYYRECPIASSSTPSLIRIQNNSLLKTSQISRIASELKQCLCKNQA